ncbi:MAG: helix-turn-helix domain-containing protein [Microbacterium sp.]|nr:helix-turn-helix domain-containing protein [Microbacterium sp.]
MPVAERLMQLGATGLSAAAIARACGVLPRTVVRWRRATGRSRAGAAISPPRRASLTGNP